MKTWLNIFVFLLLAAMPLQAQTADDCDVIDMRSGLPENRVRCLAQLADGRIAIVTAATITVYDGTHFVAHPLKPNDEYTLNAYHGKRHLTCDSTGLLWLRNARSLYVFDAVAGRMVAHVDSLLAARQLTAKLVSEWPTDTARLVREERQTIGQAIGKEVMAVLRDSYGGLWIGTKENGIYYYNPQRKRQFRCEKQELSSERQLLYCSPRGSELSARYAPQATNCTLEADGYLYIGARNGVMVVDRSDSLVAVISEDYGLLTSNVAALISDGHGDVWAATAGGGITRLHRTGDATFDVVNYGRLDGVETEGMEFRTCHIRCDSDGFIRVGFVGGTCIFCPDSVKAPRYTFHYAPQRPTADIGEQTRRYTWAWLLAAALLALTVPGLAVVWLRRKRANGADSTVKVGGPTAVSPSATAPPADQESISSALAQKIAKTGHSSDDELFVEKIKALVEQHLDDENFSVQTLSELMAMDRTVLYRRMQTVTRTSPSVYIKKVRLGVAKRLLCDTDMPIRDVAFKTGFATVKYFSAAFKDAFGSTPNEYRANIKKS